MIFYFWTICVDFGIDTYSEKLPGTSLYPNDVLKHVDWALVLTVEWLAQKEPWKIESMDRLLLDSSENSDLKEKLDQAKEQIKQLIKQGSDLREKNERLESQQRLEARNKRPGIECNGDKTVSVQSTVSTSEEISQSHSETTDGKERRTARLEILVSRPIMAAGFLSILILGIFLGRYIIL